MKLCPKLLGILWFIGIILFLSTMFTAAYLFTGWAYTIIGWSPPALIIQIINSVGGLFFGAFVVFILSHLFFKSKIAAGEMRAFGPIIEALQRIAKGDFSVRVIEQQNSHEKRGVVGKLATSVNQMALQLDQMESMRQEFISNVSHEIQSPLTSIRGFAQVLYNENLSHQERVHYLSIIETESTRLSRVTENLLRLATLESAQPKFEPKLYRLDRQIRNLILACEPQWADKQIEMDVALDEIEMTADEDLLSQVWINLLHNSIKFTPDSGKICIELHQRDGRIEFRIKDTGIGISEEDQAHIFERFYKADKSRTRFNNGGSGLGLSIAQKIVDMHNGAITVQSEPGAGATFTVSLPIE